MFGDQVVCPESTQDPGCELPTNNAHFTNSDYVADVSLPSGFSADGMCFFSLQLWKLCVSIMCETNYGQSALAQIGSF